MHIAFFTSPKVHSRVRAAMLAIVVPLLIAQPASATFSICAVDTVTGAIGSAGASCIGGAYILSGITPNFGVVHTQAWWNAANQDNADSLMQLGIAPDSIVSWLVANDSQDDGRNQSHRQYGVVTLAGPGLSSGHTGTFTDLWRGHINGPGYAIQGNILLDSTVIYDMETAYLTTPGPLEDKLMAALQAAKVPGADTRCMPDNKSAISAFIEVRHLSDGETPHLFLNVSSTVGSTDPIDVLQDQFDTWQSEQIADPNLSTISIAPAALPTTGWDTALVTISPLNANGIPPTKGAAVTVSNTGAGTLSAVTDNGDGTFTAVLTAPTTTGNDTVSADIHAGGQIVGVAQSAAIIYFLCGDATFDGAVNSADIIYMVSHIFKGGFRPEPVEEVGDVNRSGSLTSADIIYMVQYVFKGGPTPCP